MVAPLGEGLEIFVKETCPVDPDSLFDVWNDTDDVGDAWEAVAQEAFRQAKEYFESTSQKLSVGLLAPNPADKLDFIKLVRRVTGVDLLSAKEFVEGIRSLQMTRGEFSSLVSKCPGLDETDFVVTVL